MKISVSNYEVGHPRDLVDRLDTFLSGIADITINLGGQDILYCASTLEFCRETVVAAAFARFMQGKRRFGLTKMPGPEIERDGFIIACAKSRTKVTLKEKPSVKEELDSADFAQELDDFSIFAIGEYCFRTGLPIDYVIEETAGQQEWVLLNLQKLKPRIESYCAQRAGAQ